MGESNIIEAAVEVETTIINVNDLIFIVLNPQFDCVMQR